MNQANTERLVSEHPLLYRDGEFFDCLDGWYELIRELSDALETLCAQQKRWRKRPMVSSQVKEKLGGLRFYVDNIAPGAEKLIASAEVLSGRTCEVCGSPGSVRSRGGHLMALCERHAAAAAQALDAFGQDDGATLNPLHSHSGTRPSPR